MRKPCSWNSDEPVAGTDHGRHTCDAALGLIPAAAAAAITDRCERGGIDVERLATDGALAGTVVIPLVAWLKQQLPEHAAFVHHGGTSQDVIDTALVLQVR